MTELRNGTFGCLNNVDHRVSMVFGWEAQSLEPHTVSWGSTNYPMPFHRFGMGHANNGSITNAGAQGFAWLIGTQGEDDGDPGMGLALCGGEGNGDGSPGSVSIRSSNPGLAGGGIQPLIERAQWDHTGMRFYDVDGANEILHNNDTGVLEITGASGIPTTIAS